MDDADTILAIERDAFDRWARGDPDGFIEACALDVDYFDPYVDSRLEGLDALRALYGPVRGKIPVDRWEMLNPRVVLTNDMAVLTFNFIAHVKDSITRWNTTEVYRRGHTGWRIVHTHWSLTRPQFARPHGRE
jgi:hypothetical protein